MKAKRSLYNYSNSWWLRSADSGDYYYAAYVDYSGYVNGDNYYSNADGVSTAFVI